MNPILIRKTLIASSVALTLGAPAANAAFISALFGPYDWSTDRANFTMLSGKGFIVGGTNDVAMVWDGNGYNSSSDYTGPGGPSNVTLSSTTPFFGYTWTAHDIQIFVPGSYSFDTALGGGNLESGTMNVNLAYNQLGMHMLFDWNGNLNIDVFVVAAITSLSVFGSGVGTKTVGSPCTATTKNCLWTGKGWVGGLSTNAPTGGQTWMLASGDGNGDGIMGIPMAAGGPFGGFNANFNANLAPIPCCLPPPEVPVPAAVWLFGSGLIGLLGVAKRRKH
jgi:hypothetical protein